MSNGFWWCAGLMQYRGYPIEQLAEDSTFLETAYLLLNGVLHGDLYPQTL